MEFHGELLVFFVSEPNTAGAIRAKLVLTPVVPSCAQCSEIGSSQGKISSKETGFRKNKILISISTDSWVVKYYIFIVLCMFVIL